MRWVPWTALYLIAAAGFGIASWPLMCNRDNEWASSRVLHVVSGSLLWPAFAAARIGAAAADPKSESALIAIGCPDEPEKAKP